MRVLLCWVVAAGMALTGCDDPPEAEAPPPETPRAIPETPQAEPSDEPEDTGGDSETPERAPARTVAQAREVRTHLTRARRANRAGELETALTHYRAAVAVDRDGRALCEMGWVLFQSEQTEAARDALTRGLAALPTHDPVPEAFVGPVGSCLYNVGRLEEEAGNTALARRHYTRSLVVRPGNRTVQARLDALPSQEGTAVVGGVPACSDGPAEFDLDAWVGRVRGLEGPLDTMRGPLAQLGLTNIEASSFVDIEGQGEGDDSPLSATVTQVPMRLGAQSGVAVHVSLDDHMGGQFDGVAVLRAGGEGYCRLGTITESVDACSTSCASDEPMFELRTEALVAENRDALRVVTRTGSCACGSYRGGRHDIRFLGVEGDRLVRYTSAVQYEGWYQSPWPPTSETSAEVTLGTDFPRTITVVQQHTCEPCGESIRSQLEAAGDDERARLEDALFDECGPSEESCDPGRTTRRLSYRNGTYAVAP